MPETFHSSEQVKVFILYLLEKIGYPLEYNDLASIVLRDGYVDYFDFVKNFHELLEQGHICAVEEPRRIPEPDGTEKKGSEGAGEDKSAASVPDDDGPDSPGEEPEESEEARDSAADESEPDESEPDDDVKVYGSGSTDERTPERGEFRQTAYVVTSTGRMIARGLSDDLLLAAVREKSYVSAMRHLSLEKRGAVWNHSLERDGDGYIFHCSIRDRDGVAFSLDLRADSYPQAERMRMNFEDKPDVVYRGIVAMVTGNVNYLFDK